MAGSDNASAKKALLYCFTDVDVDITNNTWEYFYTKIANPINTGRNYYYLVLDKNNATITLNSLLTLARVTSNGSNLPFQIPWKHNCVPVQRTFNEAYRFLIDVFKESVNKCISVHNGYENL